MKWPEIIAALALTGVMSVLGNSVLSTHLPPDKFVSVVDGAVGYAIMMILALIGVACSKYLPGKLPMVFWVSVIATAATSPICPWAKEIGAATGKVDFLALATPILAFAGLSIGKDLDKFKSMSWRIIVVALAVFTGTFVMASIIAQIMLKFEGLI